MLRTIVRADDIEINKMRSLPSQGWKTIQNTSCYIRRAHEVLFQHLTLWISGEERWQLEDRLHRRWQATTMMWHLNSEAHLPTKKTPSPYDSVLTFPVARASRPATRDLAALKVTSEISFRAGSCLLHQREGEENSAGAMEQMPKDLRFLSSFMVASQLGVLQDTES